MTSVITGDIIHSQKANPSVWLEILKKELNDIGKNPFSWEIYRGDSFQIEVTDPFDALQRAIKLKAAIKNVRGIDVRMSIGIGDKIHNATKITESNGSAFVYSGENFEKFVKKRQNLAVATASKIFNRDMNLYIRFALIAMNNWSVNSAQMVKVAMENPDKSQKELGELLGIKQNAVSNRLKRAFYDEIKQLIEIYKTKLQEIL